MSKSTQPQEQPDEVIRPAQPVGSSRRARRRVDPDGDTVQPTQPTPPAKSFDDVVAPPPPAAVVVTEPLEDSFEDAAAARAKARDRAVVGSPVAAAILQVVLAILAPVVILIGVIRLVASPLFLWFEYHRPGFPADEFGMDTEQRLTLGSYGLDFLFNLAPASYLGDLTFVNGNPVFTDGEVAHMVDVKQVMMFTGIAGVVAALVCVVLMIMLYRMRKGAIARSFFAGAIWFTAAMILLGVTAVVGWEAFFAGFHQLFFADGTWTFYTTDTLIRLYPGQFWVDAAAWIAGITLAIMVILMVLTAPTGRRRFRQEQAQRFMESQATGRQQP